jgi:hypothetical protein
VAPLATMVRSIQRPCYRKLVLVLENRDPVDNECKGREDLERKVSSYV